MPAVTGTVAPTPAPYARRGDAVEAHFNAYKEQLQRLYDALCAAGKRHAPDLYPQLQVAPPKPVTYGYGILPKLLADPPPPTQRPRATPAWYTWPWTDQKIDTEVKKIEAMNHDLDRIASLAEGERHSAYEKLVAQYPALRGAQQNIDSHVQYNRLWQAAIAGNKAGYDRQTVLYYAVLERQAILDALDAPDEAAFRKALAGVHEIDASKPRVDLEPALRAREQVLSGQIHEETDNRGTPPPYVGIEHPSPHLWTVTVRLYTDIADPEFLAAFKHAVETIWRVRDGVDEFRIEVNPAYIDPQEVYQAPPGCTWQDARACTPPHLGEHIDVGAHIARFPKTGAVLTTGARLTHVMGTGVALGPHDATPHALAHEIGHLLGFRDVYFRGYEDLGSDGYRVMEVVADPYDIMGNPGSGPVLRRHFERLISAVPAANP